MSPLKWSSTRRSLKANWKLQNTRPGACMTSTSSRSTRTSDRGRSGVCRTLSHQRSKSWIHSTLQGYGETGRIPGGPVLRVVLAHGAVSADRSFLNRLTAWSAKLAIVAGHCAPTAGTDRALGSTIARLEAPSTIAKMTSAERVAEFLRTHLGAWYRDN
jgi:hypothetical protein